MAFDLTDCTITGPALPEPFVKFDLEKELSTRNLLPKTAGDEGKKLKEEWAAYRKKLYNLTASGGPLRIRNHVIEPLLPILGYSRFEDAGEVQTREGLESGGTLLLAGDNSARLRVWTTSFDEDLHSPSQRGNAWRFSHLRVAQRVLLAAGERIGILTNGVHLLILISDPARPDSVITIPVESGWKRSRELPDSFRLVGALCSPAGITALPELVEKARLQQARVTKELRVQARQAVEGFIQEILDHPANSVWFAVPTDRDALAKQLWHEGLYIVYRLLFVFKLESTDDSARVFTFASTSLWRNTFSPSIALAPYARKVLDSGIATGSLLENGLRTLFRLFEEGIECTELVVKPLGGALFGKGAIPVLSERTWGERAVARLLDKLLWTSPRKGGTSRERVHYGPLDVEDLGRVYEALLELEPGISGEKMCRLRRNKLEVVVPFAQGEKYRPAVVVETMEPDEGDEADAAVDEPDVEEESSAKGKKTKVEWIEAIPPGRFYLRVGLGRKATGSYYTPHSFVRFLIQETLGPQVEERSPRDKPQPLAILKLKVLDPAMGSGHFLVEACRFLGDKLYEACRLCDDLAATLERQADDAGMDDGKKQQFVEQAAEMRQRVVDLPDPDDELLRYLPSRSVEGEASGYSQKRAEALCRRLVATHCLYGVDKNPLAVELAKLALWLESHAEGMPLTFMDHRLVAGDSLTGPFWDKLIFRPGDPKEPLDNLFHAGLNKKLAETLRKAVRKVQELEATVGVTVAEIRHKENVKAELDRALLPFHIAAAAWSGGVMLGSKECDDTAYGELLQVIAGSGDLPERVTNAKLRAMIARGLNVDAVPEEREGIYGKAESGKCVPSLAYDLTFPEVFYPSGQPWGREGFDAVVGNPPWDRQEVSEPEFWASFDLRAVESESKRERDVVIGELIHDSTKVELWEKYTRQIDGEMRFTKSYYLYQSSEVDGAFTVGRPDIFKLFAEKIALVLKIDGFVGVVVPSAFHANEGTAGIRKLYLDILTLVSCYSFENRRKLFEIDSRFKFATVIARKRSTELQPAFKTKFYLHDDSWLFTDKRDAMEYTPTFIRATGGKHLSFIECRTQIDANISYSIFSNSVQSFSEFLSANEMKITGGLEIHRAPGMVLSIGASYDAAEGFEYGREYDWARLPVIEGKAFHQFDDCWDRLIKDYAVKDKILKKAHWEKSCPFYRFAIRTIASSTNERTIISAVLQPAFVTNHSVLIETKPGERLNKNTLLICAVLNSFVFDWLARARIGANINQFIINPIPIAKLVGCLQIIVHSALRLNCNHRGYKLLWEEQLGIEWREPTTRPPFSWPVLQGDDERWEVRSAIDAVVAEAYGLDRSQYVHVLSTFSHSSYKKAPELCLAKFDELKSIGLDAFTKKYDPYWDIPLNENLPKPVIELPGVDGESPGAGMVGEEGAPYELVLSNEAPVVKGKRKKK